MILTPQERHMAFRADTVALLDKHAGKLSAQEMLALSAHLVGQLLAMQDQRTMTKEKALDIVGKNIEVGNKEVVDGLLNSPTGLST